MSLIVGKLQSTFCLVEVPVKVAQFQRFAFILALEISFLLMKTKLEIGELIIFDHCYLYSAYAVDTTFFFFSHRIPFPSNIWLTLSCFFGLLRIKTKLIKMGYYSYWSSERGLSGSLWYALFRSKY